MLVIPKAKALALKLKNPERVLSAVKSAKPLTFKGTNIIAVPHRIRETQALRRLGIRAPSPILHHYEWAGSFKPYEHQRMTAAFLTMHDKCLVLNDIGCVDADTEYLSPTGWRRIADYDGGAVAQYWPDTKKVDYVDSPEFVKLPCDTMLKVKTKYGVDQMLSPEHRVLVQSRTNPEKRETLQAHELKDRHDTWVGGGKAKKSAHQVGYTEMGIPTVFQGGRGGIAITNAQLRLMVAVIADGHFPGATDYCLMRLKKQRKKDRIRDLLDAAHVPYVYQECKPDGFHVVKFRAPRRDKEFGKFYWAASHDQLDLIADEVKHWDACRREDKQRVDFSTLSRASADFVQYAYAATGHTARLLEYPRRGKVEYCVTASLRKRGHIQMVGSSQGVRRHCMEWVENPDGYKYCFMVPSTYLVFRRNGCVFMSGNTGKSISALWAADYLMQVGAVRKVLIMSPLSTLERVWGDAIFTHFWHRKSVVLSGAAKRRAKLLKTDADFYIINHDGFQIIAEEAMGMFDLVVVDEAAVLRTPSTNRYKRFARWAKANPDTRLWLMTGTPTPNEPTDAWTLAQLVGNPDVSPSFTRFREQVMIKVGQHRWVPRPDSSDTVKAALRPAVRYTRDECFDLPDTVIQTRKVDLTAEQRAHYDTMMRRLVVEASSGTITAVNEAVKVQKLVQIACGVAYTDDQQDVEIDCTPRVNAVKEVIEEAGEKVIVFVPLTGTLHMLERELSKRSSVAVVNGAVPANKRNQIFHDFQNGNDPRVLIAHPATMAHGLTLTAASTVVWYGPITSNEQYTQANGRVERIGKRHVSNVVHIEATQLEHAMYHRLASKQKVQGLLLDLIQQAME